MALFPSVYFHLTEGKTNVIFMIFESLHDPTTSLPLTSLALCSSTLSLLFCDPATLGHLLIFEDIRHDLTSVSLYWPFLHPGMFFPQIMWFTPSLTSGLHSKFILFLTSSLYKISNSLLSMFFFFFTPLPLVVSWHLQPYVIY